MLTHKIPIKFVVHTTFLYNWGMHHLGAFYKITAVLFFSTVLSLQASAWKGPTTGPRAVLHKKIFFIASDMKNGGVKGVSDSFKEASAKLKWTTTILDGVGDNRLIRAHLTKAIRSHADGIIIGGFDASDFAHELTSAQRKNIKLVAWHTNNKPGPAPHIFSNITTDPIKVAIRATEEIPHFGKKEAGVIILTDSRFSIATSKALQMKRTIENMRCCKVLSVEDVNISSSAADLPKLLHIWNQRYGEAWTHTLAINDIYFDRIDLLLQAENRPDIVAIAAGDGSTAAIERIKSGVSQQMVTIAEPLQAHGWQVADEMNRAFANKKHSDFISEPIVVTKRFLGTLKTQDIEENSDFKESYLRIWFPQKNPPKVPPKKTLSQT